LYVKHTAHLVTILCLETTIVKTYIFCQLGVYKTKAFLLTASNEVRPENFKVIDVDKVLIVVAATYAVLRREFIVTADKDFYEAFNTA
jgi:hypothetical protein